jgi:hypothetical protein
MPRLIAGHKLRAVHARLEDEGRLGERIELEVGAYIDEIKRRRKVFEHPEVTSQPSIPGRNSTPAKKEVDEFYEAAWTVRAPEAAHEPIQEAIGAILDNAVQQPMARARLREQGSPLAAKQDEWPGHVPGRPTNERLARQGGEEAFEAKPAGAGEVTPLKRYRVKGLIEAHEMKFAAHIVEAFQNFRDDVEAAGITHVTANYDGFSGGGRGPKTGGLGGAPYDVRQAYWRHHFRMEMIAALSHKGERVAVLTVLSWILLAQSARPGDAIPTLADIGRKIIPWFKNEAMARGVAWGWIEFAGRYLAAVDHAMEAKGLRTNGGPGLTAVRKDVLDQRKKLEDGR